ncbi:hypothetical protein [Sphingopyxis fribergensis]
MAMSELYSESDRLGIMPLAPTADEFTPYDAAQMLAYARLLDAERQGHAWQDAARDILLLDVEVDVEAAKQCWQSHYDRALWSVGDGLLKAAEAGSDMPGR